MIDKRISYRFGGGYQGSSASSGPAGGASSGGNYGGNTGGGGHRGGGADRDPPPAPAPAPAPAPQPTRAPDFVTSSRDPDPVTEVVPGDKTFEPVKKYSPNIGPSLHGGDTVKEALKKAEITKMIRDQALEKLDVIPDDTTQLDLNKFGETVTPVKPDLRTEKEKEEDWERDQDWGLIKDLSKKGYDFDEIQDAVEKGLTVKAPTTDTRRQDLIDYGLRSIIPETGLEKTLLGRAKSFMPDSKTGIMGTIGDYFNPGKMFTNFALSKMGLGFLNPLMGLASLFGFKNPLANIGTKYAGVPYKEQPVIKDDRQQIPENVMQASIKKFQPTDKQTAQMNEIMRKRMILQGYADKGSLNERGMNTLAQMNQMISQYQANPASIWT